MHHTPTRDQFKHWTTIEVRWSEIDGYGHLNNVAYFSYFEAGRTRYILATCKADALSGRDALHVMVNCIMNFRQEVRFPAIIDVGIAVNAIGTTSYTMQCAMFRAGSDVLVADGTGKLVVVSPSTKRPMPVPEEYIRNFESLEERTIPRL